MTISRISQAEDGKSLDFTREIQPILAKKCFRCHGPTKSGGDLRLDQRNGAISELPSGQFAIVPGQPKQSDLIAEARRTRERNEAEEPTLTRSAFDEVFAEWGTPKSRETSRVTGRVTVANVAG